MKIVLSFLSFGLFVNIFKVMLLFTNIYYIIIILIKKKKKKTNMKSRLNHASRDINIINKCK